MIGELEKIKKEFERWNRELDGEAERWRKEIEIERMREIPPSGKICSVDCGVISKTFLGAEIMLCRCAGVSFNYVEGKLSDDVESVVNTSHHTSYSVSEGESLMFKSIKRVCEEINMAVRMAEKTNPKAVVIDGSILPLPSDKPGEQSRIKKEYEKLMDAYVRLYEQSKDRGFSIVGVVKDTRSRSISNSINSKWPDQLVLNRTLNPGEMTKPREMERKRISKELEAELGSMWEFYAKGNRDIPLRVEVYGNIQDAIEVLSTCPRTEGFYYPPILVEADLRSKMSESEAHFLEQLEYDQKMVKRRRDNRPFR